MIPKIIHYCWLSDDPVPQKFEDYIKGWHIQLPDYEFMKWDFTKFDINSSEWVKEAFHNKKYAFACDYIRLFAVYSYGGIYMDMDIEVIKSFNPLLDKPYMFAYEGKKGQGIEAGCFGAEKNNEFLRKCLGYYKGRHFVKEDRTFDTRPLPQIMQEVYNENGYNYQFYNHEYFTAKSFNSGIVNVTQNTYAVHHFAGSWKTDAEKERIIRLQSLSKKYGWFGKNYAEIKSAKEDYGIDGVIELMKSKIGRKVLRRK